MSGKKKKKKRADKYESKLSIDGTFDDVLKISTKSNKKKSIKKTK